MYSVKRAEKIIRWVLILIAVFFSFSASERTAVAASVAYVRSAGASGQSTLYTTAITPASGNFLAVFVWQTEGATTPTVTDNLGTVYTLDCDLTYNQGFGARRLTVYHVLNAPNGITGVRVTPNRPSRTIVAEYSGMPVSGAILDGCGVVNNQSSVTSWTSTAVTTTANDLVFGLTDTGFTGNAGYNASGLWTGRLAAHDSIDGNDSYLEERINVAAGSYTATGTTATPAGESSVVVAFKTGSVTLLAPSITSTNSTTFTVGTAKSFTVTAIGSPTPTLSVSGTLPAGVMFTTATGVLSGTPTGSSGTYPITFTAQNGVSPIATQNFTLTVNPVLVAPSITSTNNATFTIGTAGSFTVTAVGSPAPTLSASGTLPTGVTFTAATGVLSGLPTSPSGTYPITFSAQNGVAPAASQNFILTVNQSSTSVGYVRSAGASGQSTLYTTAITPASGNFLAVFVWQTEGATTPTVTDNLGTVYTLDCDLTYNQGFGARRLTVYHVLNAPNGITGVRVTPNRPSRTIVAEYSGMPVSGAILDGCGVVNNQSSVTSWTSTAVTTTANDLVFGLTDTGFTGNAGYNASGLWTGRLAAHDSIDGNDSYLEERINVAAGSYTATGTTATPAGESSVVVAFKTGSVTLLAPSILTQPINQSVVAGKTATFSVIATGAAPMTYQWQKNGTAISGATSATYTTPPATTSDNGTQFTAKVTNPMGSATSSAATLTVNAATLLFTSSPTALNFGIVTLSFMASQNVALTNVGNSNVTIANVGVSGAGFNASGVPAGLIVSPGQTVTLVVTFAPAAAGLSGGSVTVTSNATNSPLGITLSGTGAAPVAHYAVMSWTPSTSTVIGYNCYSSTASGGPYKLLNATPLPGTTFTDTSVQSGKTYYYVVTAIDSNNVEGAFSAEKSAMIP